jgi:hypothetical protein
MRRFPLLLVLLFLFSPSARASDTWEAIHLEMHEALALLSKEYFGSPPGSPARVRPDSPAKESPLPWMVVVGFTGGIDRKDSKASGIVAMRNHLESELGGNGEVLALTYNNFRWRRAANDIRSAVRKAREEGRLPARIRQPLIIATGHGWGAGSITGLAKELSKDDLEISLAVYIDSLTWRNPRLPANVRYAVNFYQRSGTFFGLPFRGKSKLVVQDPSRTTYLGSYRITPRADRWGWSWNLFKTFLYRRHHLMAHDVRLKEYLLDIVQLQRTALERLSVPESPPAVAGLFDRVVILGASVSDGEKADSPGLLLVKQAGTPEERIHVFAEGGAASHRHEGLLDNIERLKPSLIIALDLFYHDFKISLFLRESKKEYLRDYIRRLHDTGAVVVIGNIPDLVLLRSEHANRYLEELAQEFPRLVLLDVRSLNDQAKAEGILVNAEGREMVLTRRDLFHDREHPNILGSTLLANFILESLRKSFPDRCPELPPLDLAPYLPAE